MNLEIIKAHRADWDQIRRLRNGTRASFENMAVIESETHEKFMNENGDNYYVASVPGENSDGYFVGFVGVVNDDIRFAIHPLYQSKGYGTRLLQFIREKYPLAYGKIKHVNPGSKKAFQKAGYRSLTKDLTYEYFINASPQLSEEDMHYILNKHFMRCFECREIKQLAGDIAICKDCALYR